MTDAIFLVLLLAATFAAVHGISRSVSTYFASFDAYQERDI